MRNILNDISGSRERLFQTPMPESIEMLHRILPAVKEYDCECGQAAVVPSEIERANAEKEGSETTRTF